MTTATKRTAKAAAPKPVNLTGNEEIAKGRPGRQALAKKAVAAKAAEPKVEPIEPTGGEANLLPVPDGQPTNQQEWTTLVVAARNQHKAYELWVTNGKIGGRRATPPRDLMVRLQGYREAGIKRTDLPEGPKNAHRLSSVTNRRQGAIPTGKTASGHDRMGDAEIVTWVQNVAGFAELGNAALHNRFRKAGFGANAKRFAKLVEQAKKAPVAKKAAAAKATPAKKAAPAKATTKPRGRQTAK